MEAIFISGKNNSGRLVILIFLFIGLLFISNNCSAKIDIETKANKLEFESGDEVIVITRLRTINESSGANITLFSDLNGICTGLSTFRDRLHLKSNDAVTQITHRFKIPEGMQSGSCYINSYTMNESGVINARSGKKLKIVNGSQSIDLRTLICNSKDCENKKTTFLTGESVYLDYQSDRHPPKDSLNSWLTYPNGHRENIDLPKKFVPQQLGTYSLILNFSHPEYNPLLRKQNFYVLEEKPDISAFGFKKSNGTKLTGKEERISINLYIFIVLILFLSIIIYMYEKKK